jgi:ribosomal protein S18 acetylase RimI-like enzyme
MIIFKDSLDGITSKSLVGFFEGWPNPPSSEKLYKILNNSSHFLLAIEVDTDQVIGFINALSDNVLSAYIPLLEVKMEYRSRGIGKELVERMMRNLKEYYMIDIICDENMIPFYEKVGMKKSIGMTVRNLDSQIGID